MKTRTKIVDLASLRMAKSEIEADLLVHELNIRVMAADIKHSFFHFSFFKGGGFSNIKSFIFQHLSSLTAVASGFLVNTFFRPKGRIAKKLTIAATTLLMKKFSANFKTKIKNFI